MPGDDDPLYLPVGSAVRRAWNAIRPGGGSTKFRNLHRTDPDKPAPCIMAQLGWGPGSGMAITVPHEPRRFTIDELRVICGFPIDFALTGSYAQQWERLGRAVPPPMMHAVAATLRDGLFARLGRTRPEFVDAVARGNDSMEKPPYRLPSMADVARARGTAGLSVVSTFSGCGGSCLGFEMAGYRVLWANEFVDAARETYAANHPDTPLDGRDIREVKPDEILARIGLERGELDVLQGSPPCASFSSAGNGSKDWGKVKTYSDTKQRTDDLFFEFVRVLEGLQPRAFVAENVAGLTRGQALGYFKEIMRALVGAGYDVRCKILDAQWLGVPQTRNRAIFVGVRKDLGLPPEHPRPLPYNYSLREVLPGLARVVYDNSGMFLGQGEITDRPCKAITTGGIVGNACHFKVYEKREGSIVGTAIERQWRTLRPGEQSEKYLNLIRASADEPSPCVTATGGSPGAAAVTHPYEPRKFTIDELRLVCGFPADFALTGDYRRQWERLGRAVPPPMMRAVAATLRDGLFTELGRTRPGFIEAA